MRICKVDLLEILDLVEYANRKDAFGRTVSEAMACIAGHLTDGEIREYSLKYFAPELPERNFLQGLVDKTSDYLHVWRKEMALDKEPSSIEEKRDPEDTIERIRSVINRIYRDVMADLDRHHLLGLLYDARKTLDVALEEFEHYEQAYLEKTEKQGRLEKENRELREALLKTFCEGCSLGQKRKLAPAEPSCHGFHEGSEICAIWMESETAKLDQKGEPKP